LQASELHTTQQASRGKQSELQYDCDALLLIKVDCMIISRAQRLFCYMTSFAVLLSESVSGWLVSGGWHVSCSGLSGLACELQWLEWVGGLAGEWRLACELQWLEWVGGLAGEWRLACELQ